MPESPSASILVLSPFFFPEPISTGRYNTALVEGLRDAGAACTVIASEPLYPDWKPARSKRGLPGIRIVRGGRAMRYPAPPLARRIVLELWYLFHVVCELPRLRESADLAIAVSPPVLFIPVARLILRKRTILVGVVHDLQSGFVEASPLPARRLVAGMVRLCERIALRSCDRLVFLSHSMARRAIEQHGLDPARCSVHLPFVSMEAGAETGRRLTRFFDPRFLHVVYAGALGEKQNPERLLECFGRMMEARGDVVCHLISRGAAFEVLRQRYSEASRIEFHDLVAEEDLAELLERSDIQVVPQLFGTSEAALPSKLPNLIAAGVPVLAICEESSEVGELVARAGAGAVVHSWEPADVAAAALRLLSETERDSRIERRKRASAFVEQYFNRQLLIDDLVKFLNQEARA